MCYKGRLLLPSPYFTSNLLTSYTNDRLFFLFFIFEHTLRVLRITAGFVHQSLLAGLVDLLECQWLNLSLLCARKMSCHCNIAPFPNRLIFLFIVCEEYLLQEHGLSKARYEIEPQRLHLRMCSCRGHFRSAPDLNTRKDISENLYFIYIWGELSGI